MDPFTQHMLEKAEQRSRLLGISNTSKYPLVENNVGASNLNRDTVATMASSQKQEQQLQAEQKTMPSPASSSQTPNSKGVVLEKAKLEAMPSKPLHHYAAVNKENLDLGIEINITTDQPIEVQLEIQEQDTTDNKSVDDEPASTKSTKPPLRDTSRNRLQRLGALYSNTNDLSSPIHRTEELFHADSANITEHGGHLKKPKQRLGKLAALADTINQWEDDTGHHDVHKPLGTVASPSNADLSSHHVAEEATLERHKVATQYANDGKSQNDTIVTKQLKWDPKVMSSLEAQGFQRRESSTVKHVYDYGNESLDVTIEETTDDVKSTEKPVVQGRTMVSQMAKTFSKIDEKKAEKTLVSNKKSGLVSGRAAIFEHKTNISSQQPTLQQRPQKDPCELPLKERMKLFENGSSQAVLPKAPIPSAPSISLIRQEHSTTTVLSKLEECKGPTPGSSITIVKPKTDTKLRDKVAALVANAQSTAESRIKDIDRQRQEDMQIITNRFNKQKEFFAQEQERNTTKAINHGSEKLSQNNQITMESKIVHPTSLPPPSPTMTASKHSLLSSKRRSPGKVNDDDTKRARTTKATATNRLYPTLSDFESSDDNGCATVTASVTDGSQQDEQDSYMDSDVSGMMEDDCNDDADENHDEQEQTEDSSAGMCNVSLGREVMQIVKKNDAKQQQQAKKTVHYAAKDYYFGSDDSSMNSSSVASVGIDDYLDAALDEDPEDDDNDTGSDNRETSRASGGSKGTTASNSFSFQKTSSKLDLAQGQQIDVVQTPILNGTQPVKSELSVNQDNDNLVTLVHTVSFYRRQQSANATNSTPMRKICRQEQVLRSDLHAGGTRHKLEYDSPQCSDKMTTTTTSTGTHNHIDEDDNQTDTLNDNALVQDKIQKLLDEVCKQQQVIGQSSQALNLCAATVEFSGSKESVEGERYLLLATNRRQACLDEVQRLRVENCLRPIGAPKERGLLTVKEITIPLRQEYVRKISSGTITGHQLVCLLKYNEYVLATKAVPTMPGLLSVKFPDVLKLNNVYADFKITLEIYGMLAQRDQFPHDVKYHINKKSGIKTPKKKGNDNRLVMPPVQSPAGPQAVRTPQLVQYGFAIFSLREIQRTTWTLTQVLGVSPLDGVVHMKVNCELSVSVEYKGFLTMFEDISGFGAWHRRWCYLNGSVLNYWKYPDDEKKKTPMGSIDLNACITQKVTTAPRDVCARLNTMLLECERPALDTDQESLIILPIGRTTIVRHLLSADTKEEREEWCAYFNKALTLLRAWGQTQ